MRRRIFSDAEVEAEAIRRYVAHVERAGYVAEWDKMPYESRKYWLRGTERRMVRERWLAAKAAQKGAEPSSGERATKGLTPTKPLL
jgi:hypothetical protein